MLLASACNAHHDPAAELEPEADALGGVGVDELAGSVGPRAILPGFDVLIDVDGQDVSLSWSDAGSSYEVWRSPEPYFAPGDPGSELVAATTELAFDDEGAACQACDDRYYVVRALEGEAALVSTTVGMHVIAVHDGFNKIPVSLVDPALEQADDLLPLAGAGFLHAYRWDAASQAWQGWTTGSPWLFPVVLGESPVVELDLAAPSFRVLAGYVPAPGEVSVGLLPGDNLVVLPLTHPDATASELLAAIPQATRIGRWDPAAQVTRWYELPGDEDFVIPSGGDLHVEVTAAIGWPLPLPEPPGPPPTGLGGADRFEVRNDQAYVSAAGALLANDAPGTWVVGSDAQSANGATVSVQPDGSFTYTPASIAWGDDSFAYTVSDGVEQEVVTVELFVRPIAYANADIGGALDGYGFPGPVTILGDVDGDGLDDVAWSPGTSGTDRTYVAFGVVHPAPLATQAEIEAGIGGFYIDDARRPRQVGDVDGDGLADVLVGNGRPGQGTTYGPYDNDNYLVFGKADTSPVTPASLAAGGGFHLDLDHVDNDTTGYGVHLRLTLRGVGDFDGDGLNDLVVSASGHDWPEAGAAGAIENAGVLFVVRGKADEAAVPLPETWGGAYAGPDVFVFRGDAASAYCGYSGWLRDADGDGRSDLLMSCGGERYLVRGRPHPGGGVVEVVVTDGTDPGIGVLPSLGPAVAQQVQGAVGDFDGDGLSDAWRRDGILFGAPGPAALAPANLAAGVGGIPSVLIDAQHELRPTGDVDGDGRDDTYYFAGTVLSPGRALTWGRAEGLLDFTADPASLGAMSITNGQGNDWDGTGDVDGDGFDDVTLWFNLLMGDRYSDAVTLRGGDGDDALVGTPGDDVAVGGRGDDVIELGAGVDAARGGAGDDTIVVEGLGFRRIDGGTGEDALVIVDAGSDVDLATIYAHRLQGIEVLDLVDAGAITLSLRALDLARLSGTSNTLTILGGAGTTVQADLAGEGFVPSGGDTWTNGVLTLVVQGAIVDVTL